ncbi:MAG: hypothetical protein R3C44_09810 [Chloroflexota bacterium]
MTNLNLTFDRDIVRRPLFWWYAALGTLIVIGLSAAMIVFIKGLGVTNLTNLVPGGFGSPLTCRPLL